MHAEMAVLRSVARPLPVESFTVFNFSFFFD